MAFDPALFAELRPLLIDPLQQGDVILSYCPVHNDGASHQRAGSGRAGRSLQLHPVKGLRCTSPNGCTFKAIVDALRARKGAPDKKEPIPAVYRKEHQRRWGADGMTMLTGHVFVRSYEYRDAKGELVAVHGRYEKPDDSPKGYSKELPWRTPSGTFARGLGGLSLTRLPLYGLPELLAGDHDAPVWWVEGEECVLALRAHGQIAVCGASGSSSAFDAGQLECLRDRHIRIWPDNDEPGRQHADAMRDALREVAASVETWLPKDMPDKGDAVDFFRAGRSLDEYQPQPVNTLGPLSVGADRVVTAERPCGMFTLRFTAKNVRRERTGVHAMVRVGTRGSSLAYSNFNVERDEDRTRLANSAHKAMPEPLAKTLPAAELKRDLDTFCAQLWESTQEKWNIGPIQGNPDAKGPPLLLGSYIIEGGGTVLFGAPGHGKSQVALLMAISIDAGVDVLWPVRQKPVLFINLERSRESMEIRLARANRVLGLDPRRPLNFVNARGHSLADIADGVEAFCRRHVIDTLFLDSISRAGMGDLTENVSANRITDLMNNLGKTWLGIGHTTRGTDTHTYGSIHFDAGADICVQLAAEKNLRTGVVGVGLQVTKGNDIRFPGQELWALEFEEDGLSRIRKAQNGEFVDVEAKENKPSGQRVREALRYGPLRLEEIAERSGLNYDTVRMVLTRNDRDFRQLPAENGRKGGTRWALRAEEEEPPDRTPLAEPQRPLSVAEAEELGVCWMCGIPLDHYDDDGRPVCTFHGQPQSASSGG